MAKLRCRCLCVMAGVCAAISVFAAAREEIGKAPERGGWIAAGKTVPLPPGRLTGGRMPAGVLTRFGPSRRLQSLLFANDTLWIGTEGGLFAYIPEADTMLEIEGPMCGSVTGVVMSDKGALWVGGNNGISVRSGGAWLHHGARRHHLFSRVMDLVQGDNRIWVGTYGSGCGYITADSIRSFSRADSLLDERVITIAEENPNTIWFGTASGLCMSDTLRWESMRYGHRIPIGPVVDLTFDEAGDLFLAVKRRGIVRYSLGRVKAFGPRDGLPGREINAVSLDPTGRVWAAGKGGVSIYDGSGWIPRRPGGMSLAGYRFLSMCHDIEGRCYLGTDGGELLVISRESGREIRIPQRFPDSRVMQIHRFGGELWFLTGRRVYVLRNGLVEMEPPGELYAGSMVDFVVDDAGELWIATRFGILHRAGGEWEVYDRRQGLPTEHFVGAALADGGDIWFGTFNRGILRLSSAGWMHYTEANGLPDDRIDDIIVDGGGTPWVVAGGRGLARFNGDSWEHIVLPTEETAQPVTVRGEQDSTRGPDPFIRFLPAVGGRRIGGDASPRIRMGLDGAERCIVATRGGIYQFSESGWRMISGPDWDSGIEPTAVLVAKNGRVWLGTARSGVFVREPGGWLHLGISHGLTDNHIVSIAEAADGSIWIGTRYGGINRFKPAMGF